MKRVRILPEILANKIAAGEVVERPASVVKELVENALDARSSRITIDIENGGRKLIRVADNGVGMNHDDALLAMERFATSKIHSDDDLFSINTLGFRGEALPSMASVSKMTLVTQPHDADSGVQISISGGKILDVNEIGAAPGTMISVAQLFFNTPARRKFLRTVNTEMGHIADTVAGMALGWPQVHFKLTHNGKTVKQWTRSADAGRRVADVLGRVAGRDLIAVDVEHGELKLKGYLGPSRLARSSSRGVYLFVNGRRVRDRVVQHALFEGYRGRLVKGQFPLAVLFVELPFDQVDVNVHPTKHEIRFVDQRRVHNFVNQQVAKSLSDAERRLWAVGDGPGGGEPSAVAQPVETYRIPAPDPNRAASDKGEIFVYTAPADTREEKGVDPGPVSLKPMVSDRKTSLNPRPVPPRPPETEQQRLWAAEGFADLAVIGQYHGTYIICQSATGLILIDQHAAHERIVYEQLGRRTGSIESQRLLMPETVELGFAQARVLEKLIPQLNELGLEIEPFGGTTFVVKSVPVLLDDRNIEHVVIELTDKAGDIGQQNELEKIIDQCRMVMACHHAIRANQRLTDEQIRHMLVQLDSCEDPSHCPHGRPTWIQWTTRELEKAFKRLV